MRGLEIRCQFALLISVKQHLRALPIVAAMDSDWDLADVLQLAYSDGEQDGFQSLERTDLSEPPCMFKDEEFLLGAWQAGFEAGRDFRFESDYYGSIRKNELEDNFNGSSDE